MSGILRDPSPLPKGFEKLAPFVERWAGADTMARVAAREESSLEDIQAFYEIMLEHAQTAADLIDQHSLHELPPQIATLCRMMLGLAHAASAVEILGAPRVPMAPYPTGVRVTRGAEPYG